MKGKLGRLLEAGRQTLSSLNMNPSSYSLVSLYLDWWTLNYFSRLPLVKQWRDLQWTSWEWKKRGPRRRLEVSFKIFRIVYFFISSLVPSPSYSSFFSLSSLEKIFHYDLILKNSIYINTIISTWNMLASY